MINAAGSSTAVKQFDRLGGHKTMINFVFGKLDPKGYRGGMHSPHGTRPDGSKGALDFEGGKFLGTADIVNDEKGNEVYAEATIEIFEDMFKIGNSSPQEQIDSMVGTFGHEAEHDLDLAQVQETKNGTYRDEVYHRTIQTKGIPGGQPPMRVPAPGSPYWIGDKIRKEIAKAREHRACPMGRCPF